MKMEQTIDLNKDPCDIKWIACPMCRVKTCFNTEDPVVDLGRCEALRMIRAKDATIASQAATIASQAAELKCIQLEDRKETKRQWADGVVNYCHERWSRVGRTSSLTGLPGEVIGNILCYLAYDAKNLPTMRAIQLTCKTFRHFFDSDRHFCRGLLLPSCFLAPCHVADEDNAGKLNLWEGEVDDIKCGQSWDLWQWRDMKKGSDHVEEFVWWANERNERSTFLCLPKNTYTFWSTINECKTWGDIRAKYTKGFYEVLMDMYWGQTWMIDCLVPSLFRGWRFSDTKDFNKGQLVGFGEFRIFEEDDIPPSIEYIQSSSLRTHCYDLFKPFGDWVENGEYDHVKFDGNEKDAILAAIKASGSNARYEPGLSQFLAVYYP